MFLFPTTKLFKLISIFIFIFNVIALFGVTALLQEPKDLHGFQNMINEKDKLVVVEFRSHRCAACNLLEKKLFTWAKEHDAITFGIVDISQLDDIFEQYDVRSLPTTIFFKNGQVRARVIGAAASNFSVIDELLTQLTTTSSTGND